jgi:poly-gamma-glutamate capsule biosynthesis protein CapA/YwtB (metallophosphatase superfamily)
MKHPLHLIACGDLVLDEPDPDGFLSGLAPSLRAADLAIGHVEVPHTHRGRELEGDVPAPASDPAHLAALGRAGFGVATLAGNHVADRGAEGIADTMDALREAGLACCGAGAELAAATRPARIERAGWRIAVLSFNCVGPEAAWASATRAGCAYLRIDTADGTPVAPAAPLANADPASLRDMARAIAAARAGADVVIVALHKGVVHTPVTLAPYERPVAHAAIDAGADVVLGHHAHILRGIEVHRGRPIYHGLGNGVVVTRALSPDSANPARAAWALRRRELFGFEPDPDYPLYPFHPEATNAMLADLRIAADGTIDAGFLPCWVEPSGRPTVCGRGARGEAVADYVRSISERT